MSATTLSTYQQLPQLYNRNETVSSRIRKKTPPPLPPPRKSTIHPSPAVTKLTTTTNSPPPPPPSTTTTSKTIATACTVTTTTTTTTTAQVKMMEERIENYQTQFSEDEIIQFMHDLKQSMSSSLINHSSFGPACFYGSDAVVHLLQLLNISSTRHAILFGNVLLSKKYIFHVTHQYEFMDSCTIMYRFNPNWKIARVRNNWSLISKQGSPYQDSNSNNNISSMNPSRSVSVFRKNNNLGNKWQSTTRTIAMTATTTVGSENAESNPELDQFLSELTKLQEDFHSRRKINNTSMNRDSNSWHVTHNGLLSSAASSSSSASLPSSPISSSGRDRLKSRFSPVAPSMVVGSAPATTIPDFGRRGRSHAMKIDVNTIRRPSNPPLPTVTQRITPESPRVIKVDTSLKQSIEKSLEKFQDIQRKAGIESDTEASIKANNVDDSSTAKPLPSRRLSDSSQRHSIHISSKGFSFTELLNKLIPDSNRSDGEEEDEEELIPRSPPPKKKKMIRQPTIFRKSPLSTSPPSPSTALYAYQPKTKPLKATPVKRKYSRRGTLTQVLQDDIIRQEFKRFANHELSEENVIFWEEVEHYRMLADEDDRKQFGTGLYRLFVRDSSPLALNLPAHAVGELDKTHNNGLDSTFDHSQVLIELCMSDTFKRFKMTPAYLTWINNQQQ